MTEDRVFFTRTMARVYADQKKWDLAIEIYRYLLSRDPEDARLAEELSAVQEAAAAAAPGPEHLTALVSEWVELMIALRRIRSLRGVQRSIHEALIRE
jgi:hypothetical protein